MHIQMNECANKFPSISFRKKRLSVAIYSYVDLESSRDVEAVKQMVEEAISRLRSDGHARVTYTVTDL